MPIRLIDIFLPQEHEKTIHHALEDRTLLGIWSETQDHETSHVQVLVETRHAEAVLDDLEGSLTGVKDYRIVIMPVVASIPRPEPEQKRSDEGAPGPWEKAEEKPPMRISRAELYTTLDETIKVSWVFVVLVILSSIVASVGLLRANVPVIIAAMVIAPMLGPNMALSLATTLGDLDLARKAFKAAAVGIAAAFLFSVLVGAILRCDATSPEIASRTQVSIADVVLALAAGIAGALAVTTSAATWLIGVMVAVALLPPLVAAGMLLGGGHWAHAGGAGLLFATNIISVNLVAVATFRLQGIRPRSWWEASKAKHATRIALGLWGGMLALLVIVILLLQGGR